MRKSSWLEYAIACGILGPILYTVEALVNGFLQPGYSFFADHISELAQFPHGWIQSSTFIVFGLMEIIFAGGLLIRTYRRNVAGIISFSFLILFGLGAIAAGIFPEPTRGLGIHGIVSSVAFTAIILAMLTTAIHWRQLHIGKLYSRYTAISCILAVVSFLVWTVVVEPKQGLAINGSLRIHSQFGHWIGLAQRINVAVWLLWLFVSALVVRKLTTPKKRALH